MLGAGASGAPWLPKGAEGTGLKAAMLGGADFLAGFVNMAAMEALAGLGRAAKCTGER